jgi:hypothetical protein
VVEIWKGGTHSHFFTNLSPFLAHKLVKSWECSNSLSKNLSNKNFDGEFEHSQLFTNLWAKNGDKLVKKWEWVPPFQISTTNKNFD